jgi:hypothetical protein
MEQKIKKSWQEPEMSSLDISGGTTINLEASNGILES